MACSESPLIRTEVVEFRVVRLAGVEPATLGLEVRCSILLSYRRVRHLRYTNGLMCDLLSDCRPSRPWSRHVADERERRIRTGALSRPPSGASHATATSRATSCAPTRCRSRSAANAPSPSCRTSLASRARRTARAGGGRDDVLAKKVAFGTPAGVIDRLTELREKLGLDGFVAELNPGERIPLELETRSLRLLTHEVMPVFK
jgi:hypothetical protein